MSIYVMLTSLTDAGRKATDEDPDSLKEINKEVEYMGVKILSQYALHDLLAVLVTGRYCAEPSHESCEFLALCRVKLVASKARCICYEPLACTVGE